MSNLMNYIKKNIIFVSILTTFLLIIIGMGIYYVFQNQDSKPNDQKEDPIVEENKETGITSFGGQFGGEDSIALTWSLQEAGNRVQRLELYHGKVLLADVSNMLRYELPLSTYQLSTGVNSFTLKAYLKDGITLTKKADVLVDYVLHASNTISATEGGFLLDFGYRYGTSNPVGIPSISFTYGSNGNASGATITYQNTTTEIVDGLFTQAHTIYFLDTSKLADGDYSLNIRYFFKDVDESHDFKVDFSVKKNAPPVSEGADNNNQTEDKDETDKPEDNTSDNNQ